VHLLQRGDFPEPCLLLDGVQADRWRGQCANGLVREDVLELVAVMLLKHVHFLQDSAAKPVDLQYVRTKEGAEIDFALSDGNALTHLIECKWADSDPYPAFNKIRPMWPNAQAVQLVRHLRNDEQRIGLSIVRAAPWLARLAA